MFSMTRTWRWVGLVAAIVLAAALAIPAFSATPARAATPEPCDIYASGGTPCEAAYSTTRALFEAYDGPLYQVQRASDSTYLNVGLESAGGVVNVAPENSFCAGTTCTITELDDQTSNGNNMPISPGTSCSGCSGGNAGSGPAGRTSAPRPRRCRCTSAASRRTGLTSTSSVPATATTPPRTCRPVPIPTACTRSCRRTSGRPPGHRGRCWPAVGFTDRGGALCLQVVMLGGEQGDPGRLSVSRVAEAQGRPSPGAGHPLRNRSRFSWKNSSIVRGW